MRDTNLVNSLREHAEWLKDAPDGALADMSTDLMTAAHEIERLSPRVAEREKAVDDLLGQNKQLILERNYVMSIIADVRKAGKTWMCQYCAHCKGIVSGMADCDSKKLCVMPYSQFELKRSEPPEVEPIEGAEEIHHET